MADPTRIMLQAPNRIIPGTQVYLPDGSMVVVDSQHIIAIESIWVPYLLSSGFIELGETG